MKNIRRQSGFTLLEVVIALAIVGTMVAILFTGVAGMTDRTQRQKNEVFVQDMAQALSSYYNSYSFEIDSSNNGDGFNVYSQNVSISSGSITNNDEVNDSLVQISQRISSPNLRFQDGYNQPMLILISDMLEKEYQGVYIPYRVIAVVSNSNGDISNDGVPDFNTTMDLNTGDLDVDNNEMVSVVNTYTTQYNKFIESKNKVDAVANSYGQYYWSRYNSDGLGEREKDYFASSKSGDEYWDKMKFCKKSEEGEYLDQDDRPCDKENPPVSVEKSCNSNNDTVNGFATPGTKISNTNLNKELDIGVNSLMDDWGNEFYIMNCGKIDNVYIGDSTVELEPRNPDSNDRNTQPYNAIIGFTMGNGQSYIKTIIARM